MSGVSLSAKLKADDLEARLRSLQPKVAQAILKRSMRAALGPMRDQLRSAWKSAPYRGRAPHRQAIARATVIDVRRQGPASTGTIVGKAGVSYKGGALQRIWHLLEHGFKHYAKGAKGAYQNLSKQTRVEKAQYQAFMANARKGIFSTKGIDFRQRGQLLKQTAAAAREQFPGYVASQQSRRAQRKQASSTRVPGAWRSKAIVSALLASTVAQFRDQALRAADIALKGGTP